MNSRDSDKTNPMRTYVDFLFSRSAFGDFFVSMIVKFFGFVTLKKLKKAENNYLGQIYQKMIGMPYKLNFYLNIDEKEI